MKYLAPVQFVVYFCRLKLELLLGLHSTGFPTDLTWRWRHWHLIKDSKRKR